MAKRISEYALSDPALTQYLSEREQELRFPSFNPDIARELGEFLRTRFVKTHAASEGVYIQIRSFPARPTCPFILYAAVAGNYQRVGAGSAYQVDGKARVVEHHGQSSFQAKAFAAMMGWPVEKMGLRPPEHIVNGGAFPIWLTNCPSPVGAVIVSGLPDVEDHQFILDSLAEFIPTLSS